MASNPPGRSPLVVLGLGLLGLGIVVLLVPMALLFNAVAGVFDGGGGGAGASVGLLIVGALAGFGLSLAGTLVLVRAALRRRRS